MADIGDSKSPGETRVGSSPTIATIYLVGNLVKKFVKLQGFGV